jgi:hypothetical protein
VSADASSRAPCIWFGYVDVVVSTRLGGTGEIEQLLEYTDWYTERWVREHLEDTVTSLKPEDRGFRLSFAGADSVTARQVVVAAGLLPFWVTPQELQVELALGRHWEQRPVVPELGRPP